MNKKGKVNGKLYDIITLEEYNTNPTLYDADTAVEFDGLLYPLKYNTQYNEPGMYVGGGNRIFNKFVRPTEEEIPYYANTEENTIDFASDNMKELIEKSEKLKNMERDILTTPDNITIPNISEHDEPAMKGFKQAIIDKRIDIDKYQGRIGTTFNNDRRLLKEHSITLGKLVSMSVAMDIRPMLILKDMSDDVPNPIGREIVIDLSGMNNE